MTEPLPHHDAPSEATAPEPLPRRTPERTAPDPWAHRRAEPRLFAFLWTLYLFVTVLGSLLWLTRSGVLAASAYGPAARIMLIVIGSGATILWPMVRLSQVVPAQRPLAAAFSDLIVVVMPVQVVVWPLAFLANWPVNVVALLAAMLFVWPALTGGLVAVAFAMCYRHGAPTLRPLPRVTWMLVCVGAVCAGPLVVVLTAVGEQIDIGSWAWKLSPFTFVFLLTGIGLRGPHAPVGLHDWYSLLPVGLTAILAWLVAGAIASRHTGPPVPLETAPDPVASGDDEDRAEEWRTTGTVDTGGGSGREPATRLDSQTNN